MHDLTETKTGNLATWAADINAAHHAAMGHAADAVAYAMQAGSLLVKAKQKLPHGEFGPWLERNCEVSARQARRYMAAAQGKPLPVRAIAAPVKTDTVAVLDWPRPSFIPLARHWYWCAGPDGSMAYVIEPSERSPGYFFVSSLHSGCDTYDCTRRPVRADVVEFFLEDFGLENAAAAIWHVRPSAGVHEALETINMPAPKHRM